MRIGIKMLAEWPFRFICPFLHNKNSLAEKMLRKISQLVILAFILLLIIWPIPLDAQNTVFCGPALNIPGIQNPCTVGTLQKAAGTRPLTRENIDGQDVCCGFDKPISGYTPDGKKEDAALRRKPGENPQLICNAALKFNGLSGLNAGNVYLKCPPKLFYDETKKQCCRYERRSRDQGWKGKCQDLAAPGRPSDCPANKERCDDPLWRDLMTEQCPKTCNRCGQWAGQNKQRGDVTTCRDGIGPNGVSECPQNKFRCNDPIYKELMRKECPKTCGVCHTLNRLRFTRRPISTMSTTAPMGK